MHVDVWAALVLGRQFPQISHVLRILWEVSDRPCFFFFFLAALSSMRILVPRPGIQPAPPAVEARSLNHWTAREVPFFFFFFLPLFFEGCWGDQQPWKIDRVSIPVPKLRVPLPSNTLYIPVPPGPLCIIPWELRLWKPTNKCWPSSYCCDS